MRPEFDSRSGRLVIVDTSVSVVYNLIHLKKDMDKIHNYEKRLKRTLERIRESEELSKKNKDLILKFHNYCFSEGVGCAKTERYVYDCFNFAKMIKRRLDTLSKDELQEFVAMIEMNQWSPNTKHCFKIMIRKFYRFVEGITEKGVYPEKVRWLKTNVKNCKQKLPSELLNESEIERMINSTDNKRDKAFISVLYETGCRIGEIGHLKIKEIEFDEYGARLNVLGKTGARIIRIVQSSPYLLEWINNHPLKDNPDTFVWIGKTTKKLLSYGRLTDIIKKLGKRAGIKKRVHAHLFRHSRATYLAGYLTEAQMKKYLGWAQASKMAGVYVHLNGKETEDAILKLHGIKKEEQKEESKLKPKTCSRCKTINESTNKNCKHCGLILDEKKAQETIQKDIERDRADNIMNQLVKDPEILELIKKKLSNSL